MTENEQRRNDDIKKIVADMDVSTFPYDPENNLQGLVNAEQDSSLRDLSEDEQDSFEWAVIAKKRKQMNLQRN
jgi:hypothetical protein